MNSIRVLHVIETYLNNTENWVYRLLNQLPDTKNVIAAKRFIKTNYYSSEFEYLEFPIKTVDENANSLLIRSYNKFSRVAFRLYPQYIKRVDSRMDLMHSHFAYIGWEFLPLAKQLKIPHVVSFYGLDYEHIPFMQKHWKARYSELFQRANLFLCEGSNGAKILEKMGCPIGKIRVARLGVEVEKIPFLLREKQTNRLNLLQIATLTEKKGHIFTIRAFIEALKQCPEMTLTIVGREHQLGILEELKTLLMGTVAESKVSFINQIDFSSLYEFMENYHVFIHPSCYSKTMDCEGGAPIVLLDAQATGMPVISTTHCDIPEEVINGVTGFLSPEKEIGPIVESITKFYHMSDVEYWQFARAARKHMEESYCSQANAAKVRNIYQNLLA